MSQQCSERLLRAVASRLPAIGALLVEHESEYGELIPHVFLGEIRVWALEQERAGRTEALDVVLDMFDAAYSADLGDVQEMLYVSLLEDLPDETQIWSRLGPALRAAARDLWTHDGNGREDFPARQRE